MAQAGERIGAYEVVRMIARGGMATVYEARQPALDRAVALKRLDLRTDDPTLAERFIRESRIAASFDHPNIVTVYDFFECDAVPYIAMEYLPRGSLRPFIGHLSRPQAFGVIEGVLAGLAHAERRGIAHRDLKPENVLVTTGGAVKIADFGIAKAYTNATGSFTAPGVAVGTPAYMAPEQALSREVGPFTDIYAVGVMAYELLGGAPPFAGGESPMAVMYRHVSEAPPLLAGVDPRLARWVDRMLEKRPEQRPAGAVQAWAELEEVVVDTLGPYWRRDAALGAAGDAPDAATTTAAPHVETTRQRPAPTPVQPAPRSRRRRPRLAAAAVLLALGGAATAAVLAFDGDDPPPPAASPTPAAGPRRAAAPFDFDGDRRPSAVVGLPDAGPGGAVFLPGPDQTIEVPRARPGLDFGAAVVSADFDRDGYADLAVGAPGADTRDRSRREGAVYVFAGSSDGLGAAEPAELQWPERDVPYRSARFGATLAADDLNGDGNIDLAVGTPGSDLVPGEREESGSVLVYVGGDGGLSASRTRVIRRPRGVAGFGSVLAIGDVNRDKRLDLLEGSPGPAGHASYCPSRRRWPRRCRTMGDALPGPATIAVGDVTGDRYRDVVHGVPDAGAVVPDAGAVRVWRGGRRGPAGGPITLSQESPPDVIGHDQEGDAFGTAIAVAKLDRDRFADIVVGTPGQDSATGRVAVLFGDEDGVDEARDTGYSAETPGALRFEPGSRFGTSLSLLDIDGDRRPELLVTAPGDSALEPRFIRIAGRRPSFAFRSQAMYTLPGSDARLGGGPG
jgi:tRNA A-37 threonylcarbamoyl transferase component Bud32